MLIIMQPEPNLAVLELKLEENKKKMREILLDAPVAGVYAGEDPAHWERFFDFYINFMKTETGPRGECSRHVRAEMAKHPQYYDQLLKILGLTHSSHIKDIYLKCKLFSPSEDYDQMLKMKDTLTKCEDSYSKITDSQSIMFTQIKNGLLKKHGDQFDYHKEIEAIRCSYEERISTVRESLATIQERLDQDEGYKAYMKLREAMGGFFSMWKQADKRVGFESIEKGDTFEKEVSEKVLPLILKRAALDPQAVKVVQNCNWQPKALGEIDLAVLQYDQARACWVARVLVECKSRLFDVREAYKQVAELEGKGKTHLNTVVGLVQVSKDYQYFIVTTIPEFPFLLPVQSKMKEALEKSHKNKMIEEIRSEEVYLEVRDRMREELSPLDWFLHCDTSNIIVLSMNS